MLFASTSVSPRESVRFVFSEPARSTRHSRPSRRMYPCGSSLQSMKMTFSRQRRSLVTHGSCVSEASEIVRSECERLDV